MLAKLILFSLMMLASIGRTEACTGIFKKAENGEWVFGRTMEFGASLISSDLLFIPRNMNFTSTLPSNQKGASWKTKYAHTGFGPFGSHIVADGINEKGLACGAFYFPGYAEYQSFEQKDQKNTLTNLELTGWILSNFATVDEVRQNLKTHKIIGMPFRGYGFIPPLHYFVADPSGDRIVIEYVNGQLHTYETPIGTITNSPTYDWHLTNARNYIGLRALNAPSIKIDGLELSQFGQGSGALGLPGDFTPPSRFIRASFFNEVVLNGKNGLEQVKRAFKILNQFDIPLGAVKATENGKTIYEETQWTSATDLANLTYYFHTAENRELRSISLKNLDLNAPAIQTMSFNTPAKITDISFDSKDNRDAKVNNQKQGQ